MHLFAINLNILADHVDNFLLQLRQTVLWRQLTRE